MKRAVSLLLFLIILFAFSACVHSHSFGEWETINEATCIKGGSERRVCSCGEEETRSIPVRTIHDYDEYGFCKLCKEASDERKENLIEVVITVCRTCWLLSYDGKCPEAENVKVDFSSLSHELSKPSCSGVGTASVDFEGYNFIGSFDISFKWDDEESRFIRNDGTFDTFYACDNSGQVLKEVFSTKKTLTNYRNGAAVSVLEFDASGNCTQRIYTFSGSLVSTTYASYE